VSGKLLVIVFFIVFNDQEPFTWFKINLKLNLKNIVKTNTVDLAFVFILTLVWNNVNNNIVTKNLHKHNLLL